MSVLLMSGRVHVLPKTVISSASNTYAKKSKRLGILGLPNGRLEMVIFTYSNTLLSVKYDKYRRDACEYAAENGHLDCLKYLHETAKAPWDYEAVRYAHENNQTECLQYLLDNDCPLPDRLVSRRRNFTHLINTHTHKEREGKN